MNMSFCQCFEDWLVFMGLFWNGVYHVHAMYIPWSSRFMQIQDASKIAEANPHQNVDRFLWPSGACGKQLNVGNLFILEMAAMGKL